MQRNFECPVCSNFYVPGTRIPKTLTCGHGVCATCLQTLLVGSNINCPKCRTTCNVPDKQVDKLPTNFPILEMLESMCQECRDNPHTQRCDHCVKNICDGCRQTHMEKFSPDVEKDIKELKILMKHLNDMIIDDKDLMIRANSDSFVQKMRSSHEDLLHQLGMQLEVNISSVQSLFVKDAEALLDWREKLMMQLTDCKIFLEKEAIRGKHTSKEYQQKISLLKGIETSKPILTDVPTAYHKTDFGHLITQIKRLAALTTRSGPAVDYLSASSKAIVSGEISDPFDVCADHSSGNIIATNFSKGNVFILRDTLQLIRSFGTSRQGPGWYDRPCGVAISHNNIYVADLSDRRIYVTDGLGDDLYGFGSGGTGIENFCHPRGLSFDNKRYLFICDGYNKRIKVTDKRGVYIRDFGRTVFANACPMFIAVAEEKVAVTDDSGNIHFFTVNGQHIKTIETSKSPHNIHATGVVFDGHGHLLVSDYKGGRVAVMTESGEIVCFVGTPGEGSGQLKQPRGLTITKEGDLIICDTGNHRIQKFEVPHMH